MSEMINEYLNELRKELTGCDPATIQDAVGDAEEHLRAALDQALENESASQDPETPQRILDDYGTPAEIAAAYKEIEARIVPPLAPPKKPDDRAPIVRFLSVVVDPRAYASLFYMLFSLITGIIYFTWAVTGLSLSAGLFILIIGLPFFAAFLLSVRGFALVEGRIVEALLGVRMPRRAVASKKYLNMWERFKAVFTDRNSWAPMIYMVLMLPLGTMYFSIFVTLIAFGLSGIAQPVFSIFFDYPLVQIYHLSYYPPMWTMPLFIMVGILWLLLTMHLAKAIGRFHGTLAKAFLVRE
jgi:uncharacterized membrane protein